MTSEMSQSIGQQYTMRVKDFFNGLLDSETSAAFLRAHGVGVSSCRTLEQAKQLAGEIVDGKHTILDAFQFVFSVLSLPQEYHERIITAWKAARYPHLAQYAPYTAHVMSLQFFFHIAVANNLISTRRSNATDVAYLFYLPFSTFSYLRIDCTNGLRRCSCGATSCLYGAWS